MIQGENQQLSSRCQQKKGRQREEAYVAFFYEDDLQKESISERVVERPRPPSSPLAFKSRTMAVEVPRDPRNSCLLYRFEMFSLEKVRPGERATFHWRMYRGHSLRKTINALVAANKFAVNIRTQAPT